jgi:uncharacterized membrane protein
MSLVIADYNLGDALLTVAAIFFAVIWIWILITIILDLFRDHEQSGWSKAAWLFFLVFVPVLTALIYLIVRGHGMRDRAIKEQAELQKASEAYIRQVASSSPTDELHKLNDLRQQGAISQEEFDRLKAKIVGT